MRTLGYVILGLAVVGVGVVFAAPDLVITSISGVDSRTTYVTVSNIGSNAVPRIPANVLKVWLDAPVSVAAGTPSPYSRAIGRLRPGDSTTIRFTGLPWPSNGVFRAFADADDVVSESDELNNQATADY